MGLNKFWTENKYGYLWSCLTLFLIGSFIGLIKKLDMTATFLFILVGFPIMFILGFGIYELIGGSKE